MKKTKPDGISGALEQIEKKFGEGAVMRLGEKEPIDVDSIPTGSLGLDSAIGTGGFPQGRVIEVYGPESSGKTTLALSVLAQAQRAGGTAAFIDAEHALDPEYASKIGVDVDALLISQPDSGEQALEIAEMLVRSNDLDIVIVDSVAALVPRAEIEGEMGDSHVGLQARLMSQALRKLTSIVASSRTTFVFINQTRERVGVMYGSPVTTPGGKALKFYSSVRVHIRRIASIKSGDRIVGSRVRARIVKNKCAAPFREAEFEINYSEGISRPAELLDLGVANQLVEQRGSWFAVGDTKLGQGRESAKQHLRENPDVAAAIEDDIRNALRNAP